MSVSDNDHGFWVIMPLKLQSTMKAQSQDVLYCHCWLNVNTNAVFRQEKWQVGV